MSLWQHYLQPKSIQEAINALAAAQGSILPLAGGTDLLLDLEQGRHAHVQTVLDVTGIRELLPIEIRGGELFVGAAATHTQIVNSPLVVEHAQALIEGCELIGGPQVRNVATLGGNVAHALPAADGTVALMALEAQAEIASPSGTRRLPLGEVFLGPGKNILAADELLVGFYIPLRRAGQASAFRRVMRPQGVAIAIINVAVWLERKEQRVVDVHIAVGPAGPKPWRAAAAESALRGGTVNDETAGRALELLLGEAQFRTSARRASAEYRRHLVQDLLTGTLQTAWTRAA